MAADEGPGDFIVLETISSAQETTDGQDLKEQKELEDMAEAKLVSQCEEAILRLCGICGWTDEGTDLRPFRIVIVGKHGAGKSSFINGVVAALSEDRWREYAMTGYLTNAEPITISNQRLVKCANGHRERYKNVLLPTFIDVAGLSDEAGDKVEELLRLLFYGHIEEDEPLMKVFQDIQNLPQQDIRVKYGRSYPEMRVDRVIFVASAADTDPLPLRLMSCVQRAARPSHHRTERRAIPICGVLTKMDKTDKRSRNFLEKKTAFMRQLGLNQSRFLDCSNYCDDLDPQGLRTKGLRRDLDLPLLEFMQRVCDRALRVVKDDEVLPGSPRPKENQHANVARPRQNRGAALADPLGAVGWAVPTLIMAVIAFLFYFIINI